MPVVPRDQRQVEIGQAPGPAPFQQLNESAPAESFGGGAAGASLGKSFQNLGQSAENLATAERMRAAQAGATEYTTKLEQKRQALMFSTDPNDPGVVLKKGKDALPALDEYTKKFNDYANSIEKDMSQDQLAMAKKARDRLFGELTGDIYRHTAREYESYREKSSADGIVVARNGAVMAAGDEKTVQDKIALQEALFLQVADGKAPAEVEKGLQDIRGKTHLAVIDRMVNLGADLEAQKYFDRNKGQLYGEVDNAEKILKAGNLAGESQRQSDSIYTTSKNMEEAFARASQITEPKLRDETTKRLKDLFAMKELVQKRTEEQNYKEAGNILDRTGDTNRIPRTLWGTFSVSEKSALEQYARHKREGTQPVTDWNDYYNLKTMAASPQLRSNFMRINLMQYRNKMADAEFKDLVNAQDGLRKGDDKTQKLLDGVRTDQEIVNSAIKRAGYDPNSKDDAVITETNLLRKKIDDQVIAMQERTGHKVTSKELEDITDKLIIEGRTEKRTFLGIDWLSRDKRKRRFQMLPGEKMDFDIGDVPAADRALIEQALKKRGITPSDEKILDLYTQKVSR